MNKLSIELKNLSFSYDENLILNIHSLDICEGEKVFVHGASGHGKSTLLNLITGILKPDEGSIKLLGTEIAFLSQSKKDQFRGEHIGFIFQNFNLIPYLSIRENIILPLKVSRKRERKNLANIDDEVKRITKELGIFEYLDRRVTDLSIGQQQRVAVARAFIGNPEIIIADEPTSSLDDDITESFMKLLLDEHKLRNFTLIFVSHDKRLSRFFDRKVSLSEINEVGQK